MAGLNIKDDMTAVGAGVGGGFTNTQELQVMKYKEAMKTKDKEKWTQAVQEELQRFKKHDVFDVVKLEDVPPGVKMLTTTWAMKLKSNGTYRARINMRGYEQEDGEHYDSASISSPVTNDVSIRVMLTLMLMAQMRAYIVDVKGTFLIGEFDNGEELYCKIPEGFRDQYDPNKVCWKLKKTAYGLKQAARMFWNQLLKAMKKMGFTRSSSDPCIYYKWTNNGLIVWISWIDDMLCIGCPEDVETSKNEFMKIFPCDDIGEFKEYVGCKLTRTRGEMKFTQPVLLQSYKDEFKLPDKKFETPAQAGQVMSKVNEGDEVSPEVQREYRGGVGKLLHMMRWSRPDIWNAVRECSRRMTVCNAVHRKAMLRVMKYCVDTPNRGWTLKPKRSWNGKDKNMEFEITAKADSNYATCVDTRRSVSGLIVELEDSIIAVKSGMQKIVALSVTEAEIIAIVQCVQGMLYIMRLIESLQLKVRKPMIVYSDNKGAIDLINGWSVGGGTKHMDCRIMFLRELKENEIIRVLWIPTDENTSDVFTKNVDRKTFE